MVLNTGNNDSYQKEIESALKKIAREFPRFEEASWFLHQAGNRLCDFSVGKKKVYVLGTSLPNEIFQVFGTLPVRLLGGSRKLTEVSDSELPRDTDPVTRAVYGYLLQIENDKELIVIPLVNDSSRKVAYLLKRKGKNVHTVTVPPIKKESTVAEWKRQMELLAEKLSVYTGKSYSERKLKRAGKVAAEAKKQLRIFELLAGNHQSEISSIFRMFLPFSYYLADDYEIWAKQLFILNKRLVGMPEDTDTGAAQVLLIGSPIYFPNYKVPYLLQEAGISFAGNFIVSDIEKPYDGKKGFDDLCRKSFVNDSSAAYVRNDTLYIKVSRYLKEHTVNGVVCHVLKGHIEYDFELERFERLFSQYDIPVIRLETDYSNQDVEQLRLRIEAFSEMLHQKGRIG